MNDRTQAELDSYATVAQRFWSYVDKSGGPDACWLWIGARGHAGYGVFAVRINGGKFNFTASRWSLGHSLGEPLAWDETSRQEACHRCNNPPCVNPAHLYVGDRYSNMQDAWRNGTFANRITANAAKTHCHMGHELSGSNLHIDRKRNKRECRACGAAKARRYRAQRRLGKAS
jgi:hypothetical protein